MKYKIKISDGEKNYTGYAEGGALLSDILVQNGFSPELVCGGKGICGKCTVTVNGKMELSCKYKISCDAVVSVPKQTQIHSETGIKADEKNVSDNLFLAADIGTTTLCVALCSYDDFSVIRTVTFDNPQRKYGGDVMSRIAYCQKNGVTNLHTCIVDKLNELFEYLLEGRTADCVYVAGNTTMLHILLNTDVTSLGVYPYTPVFLSEKNVTAESLGLHLVKQIVTLPCISSFVGSDIVSGLIKCGMPATEKYNILVDLGTNAECVLYSENRAICSSAAAGPCFEGGNISCGSPAIDGAICSFKPDGSFDVIGSKTAKSICATGLIDVISQLIRRGIIENTGFMENTFRITDEISITQKDVRQFQLAKAAVYSAIVTLCKIGEISFDFIDKFFVAGGFSSGLNIENAVRTGLFPKELQDKFIPINNSSLAGIPLYVKDKSVTENFRNAEYIDLSMQDDFNDMFIENMEF